MIYITQTTKGKTIIPIPFYNVEPSRILCYCATVAWPSKTLMCLLFRSCAFFEKRAADPPSKVRPFPVRGAPFCRPDAPPSGGHARFLKECIHFYNPHPRPGPSGPVTPPVRPRPPLSGPVPPCVPPCGPVSPCIPLSKHL